VVDERGFHRYNKRNMVNYKHGCNLYGKMARKDP
jgi:hypothetical protein